LAGAAAVVAVLLLFEGVARLAAPVLPEWRQADTGTDALAGHPTRLWGLGIGVRNTAGVPALINERGLRGEIPELPRPEGRTRLLVLGDSSFFGHGLADGEDLGSVAAGLLPDADVVIGAVPGYSVAQSTVFMEEEGWELQPSVLVIGHLWSDNAWDSFHDEDLLASQSFSRHNPLSHSRALTLLATALGARDPDGGRVISVSKLEPWPEGRVRRVPLQRYAELLDGLLREAGRREVGALFIEPSNRISLEGRPGDWDTYYEAMEGLAAHHDIPIIDANALYGGSGLGPDELFMDSMHPTVVGHRILAEALAEAIGEGIAVPQGAVFDASGLRDVRPPDPQADEEDMGSPQTTLFERPPSR